MFINLFHKASRQNGWSDIPDEITAQVGPSLAAYCRWVDEMVYLEGWELSVVGGFYGPDTTDHDSIELVVALGASLLDYDIEGSDLICTLIGEQVESALPDGFEHDGVRIVIEHVRDVPDGQIEAPMLENDTSD